MKPGRTGAITHDYKRQGTTILFPILEATVIGRNMQRHRHAIVDNYAIHGHPKVRQLLVHHPRWTFHFSPASASWRNAVEGFSARLSHGRIKRGVFRSVADLQLAMNRFVLETNDDPNSFARTADPNKIFVAVGRGHQVLELICRQASA